MQNSKLLLQLPIAPSTSGDSYPDIDALYVALQNLHSQLSTILGLDNIDLSGALPTPSSTYKGTLGNVIVAKLGTGVTVGKLVTLSRGVDPLTCELAYAPSKPAIGVVTEITNGFAVILTSGLLSYGANTLTVGAKYYLAISSAGAGTMFLSTSNSVTLTAETQYIGTAVSNSELLLNPSQ